jgi:hypothetical protein
MYRDAKTNFLEVKSTVEEIAGDAKAVKSWWQKLFGAKPTASAKPVAKKKTQKFVAYDETQAMADIVKELSRFWTLQDQLTEYLRTEEEKAKVYDPTVSNAQMMESAMNRVMCRQQMEQLSTTNSGNNGVSNTWPCRSVFADLCNARSHLRGTGKS